MVAGASRGLGFAVAEALAGEGAQVSIASRDEQAIDGRGRSGIGGDALGVAASTCKSADGDRARGPPTTVRAVRRRRPAVHELWRSARRRGAVVRRRAWQDAADLLLFSTLRMVRAAVPSMQARGGGAILVSTSSSVKEPIPNLGLSTVLRASVSALAKTLALELAPIQDPRQPDHSRPHRHRSRAAARRDQRDRSRASRPSRRSSEVDRGDSAGPLRRARRVRPRRRVPAVGRGGYIRCHRRDAVIEVVTVGC